MKRKLEDKKEPTNFRKVAIIDTEARIWNAFLDSTLDGDIKRFSKLIREIDRSKVIELLSDEFLHFGPYYALKCFFLRININALNGNYDSVALKKVLSLLPFEIEDIKSIFENIKNKLEIKNQPFHMKYLQDFDDFVLSKVEKVESNIEADKSSDLTNEKNSVETTTTDTEKPHAKLSNEANNLLYNQDYFLNFFVSKSSSKESLDKSVGSPLVCDNNLAELLSLPEWIQELYKYLIDFLKQVYNLHSVDIDNKSFAIDFINESSSQEILDRYLHENTNTQTNEVLSKYNISHEEIVDTNLIYMGETSYLYSNVLQGYNPNLDHGVNQLDYQVYA